MKIHKVFIGMVLLGVWTLLLGACSLSSASKSNPNPLPVITKVVDNAGESTVDQPQCTISNKFEVIKGYLPSLRQTITHNNNELSSNESSEEKAVVSKEHSSRVIGAIIVAFIAGAIIPGIVFGIIFVLRHCKKHSMFKKIKK